MRGEEAANFLPAVPDSLYGNSTNARVFVLVNESSRPYLQFEKGANGYLASEKSGCSVSSVSASMKKFGLDRLDVEQRLALIEEIWDSIDADESAVVQLNDAQMTELQARLAEDDAHPDDVISWEEVQRLTAPPRGK